MFSIFSNQASKSQDQDKYENQLSSADDGLIKAADIKRYRDPDGLTLGKMKFGLWLTANRANFKLLFIFILSLTIMYSWGLFLFTFGRQAIIGIKQDSAMLAALLKDENLQFNEVEKNSALPFEVGKVQSLRITDDRYDHFVKIKNPNKKYYASFDYAFVSGNQKTRTENSFILPNESKYVILLGDSVLSGRENADFEIQKIQWQRAVPPPSESWEEFVASRSDFEISDIKFVPAGSSALSENVEINILNFSVKNKTAYNYWSVYFNAILFNGSKIVGVNRYVTRQMPSGKGIDISMTWPGKLPAVTEIIIMPDLDITNPDIYVKFDGKTGEVK